MRDGTEIGGLVGGGFVPQEEDVQVADEFYEDADEGQETGDQPADVNITGEIYTTAALKEMLGDWEGETSSPPTKPDQPRVNSPGQNASSVSSELLINISDRYKGGRDSPTEGRRTPVEARLTAQLNYMQGQLNAALSQVIALEEMVTCQRDFISQQQSWNTSMSAEAERLNSRLVTTDAKADAAHTAAKLADSIARKSADAANKSLQIMVSHQAQLKALEASMAQLNKTQQTLSQQVGNQADRQNPASSATPPADTYENAIFFGGVHAYRERLGLHPQSDPVFVISTLLRDMGIYAGMDSIVLADNTVKSRLEVRAVIIHMQSSSTCSPPSIRLLLWQYYVGSWQTSGCQAQQ